MPSEAYTSFSTLVDDVVNSYSPDTEVLLVGDFNLPEVEWESDTPVCHNASSLSLSQLACLLNLKQYNTIRNQRGVILDLIFSSNHSTVVEEDNLPLVPTDIHHPAIVATFKTDINRNGHCESPYYDFRRCDLNKIYEDLLNTNLFLGDCVADINLSFELFSSTLRTIVLRHTPMKVSKSTIFPTWFSPELKKLVFKKKVLHKEYKKSFCRVKYAQFARVREQCRNLSRDCFLRYTQHVQDIIPVNPKIFWSYIKTIRRQVISPSTLRLNDETSDDPTYMCELFARFFSSVYSPPSLPAGDFTTEENTTMSGFLLTRPELLKALLDLDGAKGCGPDLIPPNVLKHCSCLLVDPLLELLNKSLTNGSFPNTLKQGYIVPIYKSGSREDVKNYRPIVVQPALAKVFEKLMLSRLFHYFYAKISPNQHGFMPRRSVATNLVSFQSRIVAAFSERKQLDAIYLDFSKAFDRVNHLHLIAKLKAYGISGSLLSWLQSYLEGRRLNVKFLGKLSSDVWATSGVPQGSHLGPLLFNVFINDIVNTIGSNCLLFADDIKIFKTIASISDCLDLQRSLRCVELWCNTNCMDLNVNKCFCMSFYRIKNPVLYQYQLNDEPLNRTHIARDLGVLLTQSLTPDEHIFHACSKAHRSLGLIRRSFSELRGPAVLKTLYCVLVRPILEYCSVVWSPHQITLQNEIQRVQDRFLRMLGTRQGLAYREVPVEQLASYLGLQPLTTRRKLQDIIFLHKIINYLIDSPELLLSITFRCSSRTRSRDLFWQPYLRTNYELHSTLDRIQRLGNDVSDMLDFFNPSSSSFKRELVKLF